MEKEKLTVSQQIKHMKKQGILFRIVREEEAISFLTYNSYFFKIKAYAKNFEKYHSGRYIELEFAYLMDLSQIDMAFSQLMFKLVLDIEHCLKIMIISSITNDAEDDGYGVVEDFFSKRVGVKNKIERDSGNSLASELYEKYQNHMPAWVLMELLSFGDLIKFYAFYFEDYKYPMSSEHRRIKNLLGSARFMRNAAAHGNCLLNSIRTPYNPGGKVTKPSKVLISLFANHRLFSNETRQKQLSNPVVNDFLSTLYLHKLMVRSRDVHKGRSTEVLELLNGRMIKNKDYYSQNYSLRASYEFVSKSTDLILSLDNVPQIK